MKARNMRRSGEGFGRATVMEKMNIVPISSIFVHQFWKKKASRETIHHLFVLAIFSNFNFVYSVRIGP